MALTPKLELFCQEYLVDVNATQAAVRAGYSKDSAASIGSENLRKPEVSARVHELMEARMDRVQVNSDWVLRQLVTVAERCLQPQQKVQYTATGSVPVHNAEGEGVFEFDAHGANKALELIGKHVGLFEKHNQQKQETEVIITIGGRSRPSYAALGEDDEDFKEPEET